MSILITVVNTMSITKVIEKIEKESEIVSSECLRLREGESTYEREKNDPQMALTSEIVSLSYFTSVFKLRNIKTPKWPNPQHNW